MHALYFSVLFLRFDFLFSVAFHRTKVGTIASAMQIRWQRTLVERMGCSPARITIMTRNSYCRFAACIVVVIPYYRSPLNCHLESWRFCEPTIRTSLAYRCALCIHSPYIWINMPPDLFENIISSCVSPSQRRPKTNECTCWRRYKCGNRPSSSGSASPPRKVSLATVPPPPPFPCALNCARILVVRALDCAQIILHPVLFPT